METVIVVDRAQIGRNQLELIQAWAGYECRIMYMGEYHGLSRAATLDDARENFDRHYSNWMAAHESYAAKRSENNGIVQRQ